MKNLLITPKNEEEFTFLKELLQKLGYDTRILYSEEQEDEALIEAMLNEKKEDYVPEDEIFKALGK